MTFDEFLPIFKELCTCRKQTPTPLFFESYFEACHKMTAEQFKAAVKMSFKVSYGMPTGEELAGYGGPTTEQAALEQWQIALEKAQDRRCTFKSSGLDPYSIAAIKRMTPNKSLVELGSLDRFQVDKWRGMFIRLYQQEKTQSTVAAAALPAAQSQPAIAPEAA